MLVWMVVVEWLARLIMLILVLLSVWSIAIILDRKKFFKLLDINKEFEKIKSEASKFRTEDIDLGLSRYFYNQHLAMQKGLAILGTLGSTTPFIGLLGTILGIIVAFGELSKGTSGTNAIMFALAEALILTAIGLFVAIPAVIAFNYFNKKIKDFKNEQQAMLNEFLAKVD
jgi:biopolymer transport protein ExbB/TolQ